MSREIRKVPPTWKHPKHSDGSHRPLLDSNFESDDADWMEGYRQWQAGKVKDYKGGWKPKPDDCDTFTEWSGERPNPEDYMPQWSESEATHLMMYETTSEGTPLSPAFETPEQLARWLADNKASAFGDMTATYGQWLAMCRVGHSHASMMVVSNGKMISGVEAVSESDAS